MATLSAMFYDGIIKINDTSNDTYAYSSVSNLTTKIALQKNQNVSLNSSDFGCNFIYRNDILVAVVYVGYSSRYSWQLGIGYNNGSPQSVWHGTGGLVNQFYTTSGDLLPLSASDIVLSNNSEIPLQVNSVPVPIGDNITISENATITGEIPTPTINLSTNASRVTAVTDEKSGLIYQPPYPKNIPLQLSKTALSTYSAEIDIAGTEAPTITIDYTNTDVPKIT